MMITQENPPRLPMDKKNQAQVALSVGVGAVLAILLLFWKFQNRSSEVMPITSQTPCLKIKAESTLIAGNAVIALDQMDKFCVYDIATESWNRAQFKAPEQMPKP